MFFYTIKHLPYHVCIEGAAVSMLALVLVGNKGASLAEPKVSFHVFVAVRYTDLSQC